MTAPTTRKHFLAGKGYPKEILTLSWRDWTPETAELVRQHFLGPLLQNPHWKDMTVGGIAQEIGSLRKLTEEEKYLRTQASLYSDYWDQRQDPRNSSTADSKETT
jgi:hypothetical protein